MITGAELFDIWAPEEGRWSLWAKPVAFLDLVVNAPLPQASPQAGAYRTAAEEPLPPAFADIPASSSNAAIVIDLDSQLTVTLALQAAAAGYRPVPLFAGCHESRAAVPQDKLRLALAEATPRLYARRLPLDAPPAFLLDSARMVAPFLVPGVFDNRWSVFPQDFPSAKKLLHHGIQKVFVFEASFTARRFSKMQSKLVLDQDLLPVLARWAEQGISIAVKDYEDGVSAPFGEVRLSTDMKAPWYRAVTLSGLRPSPSGGFGGIIPEPSKG